ncbi:MAG: bifunctional 5,10-methylenetetrahydrofolate dehydrogenase/5,10-methenyltetrahydrofolate cyclohydrolase [SAR202 cluster bacterium]|jgi:methylenetetrahydrofolate dehydrogenase (NADP+)/methenyltetrahydrofolate cyclohydrolase|nr:bifunctional 5,10-methylenetetrahydrofolate dehydrogenase/5,10-methenyltetrahydrofolate cyclohydrolase [SAR202 cluster bacterium]
MTANIIDGTKLANQIRSEIADGVQELKAHHNITPGLAVILVGNDPASAVYVRNKQRAATEAGMIAEDIKLPAETTRDELSATITSLANNDDIHGMLVQMPLPEHLDPVFAIDKLPASKDVDGLTSTNSGLLVGGRPRFIPATPAGIQQMLIRSGYDPNGKHVVVCGRSDIVGKPISLLLIQKQLGANATVTICHSRTHDIETITRQADILIAAIGRPRFINSDMVKKGAIVIDVGVNRIEAPERKSGYRLVGDVDFDGVSEKAKAITPVPGGVGPMTIAMLLKNTLEAAKSYVAQQ